MTIATLPPIERIHRLAHAEGDCLVFTGMLNHGYGKIRDGGRMIAVHRVVWENAHGRLPAGLEIDHLCQNRACVRLDHLEAVTHRENMRRRLANRTHCRHGHPWTPDNLTANGICFTCHRERNFRYRRRLGQAVGRTSTEVAQACPAGHRRTAENTWLHKNRLICRVCTRERIRARYWAARGLPVPDHYLRKGRPRIHAD